MDSTPSDAAILYGKRQISSSVSAVDAPAFFKEHGVFYQENAEIGRVVAELDKEGVSWEPSEVKRFLPILENDLRIGQILKSFDTQRRPACWVLGSNYPKHHFASTISEDEDEDHRMAVYMCSTGSELEIFCRSHYLPSAGVPAEVPYPFLTVIKKLKETEVWMQEGGVMIVHPRFAIGSNKGRAIGYGLPEKGYQFKPIQRKQ
ncbi:hypothetical protein FPRO05_14274 [Fusarium proliferatum]|uniref:TauD/TfdA-like domain-containing protein n=1 Tax=Gibberella intermedia TaxID=948311 RepID=A0A365MR75_GIBIN|nr:hypothetical protein FPRO05_14274 [Fusarium proliferatum]